MQTNNLFYRYEWYVMSVSDVLKLIRFIAANQIEDKKIKEKEGMNKMKTIQIEHKEHVNKYLK